jgi:hypothetical protein
MKDAIIWPPPPAPSSLPEGDWGAPAHTIPRPSPPPFPCCHREPPGKAQAMSAAAVFPSLACWLDPIGADRYVAMEGSSPGPGRLGPRYGWPVRVGPGGGGCWHCHPPVLQGTVVRAARSRPTCLGLGLESPTAPTPLHIPFVASVPSGLDARLPRMDVSERRVWPCAVAGGHPPARIYRNLMGVRLHG